MAEDTIDFFVSYTSTDAAWAEWIAWQLKVARYSLRVQAWHFVPGSNFSIEMDDAAKQARRTILVLSPRSLEAPFVRQEIAAALSRDPTGKERALIPARVEKCEPGGLLHPIVYIDLVGLGEEQAVQKLLCGVRGAVGGHFEPQEPPPFPTGEAPPFPVRRQSSADPGGIIDPLPRADAPSASELRRELQAAFDDSQFDAFCLDYFPFVYERFSGGMDRDRKATLLLDHCRRTRQIGLLRRKLEDRAS
jgi:hypothetical protein